MCLQNSASLIYEFALHQTDLRLLRLLTRRTGERNHTPNVTLPPPLAPPGAEGGGGESYIKILGVLVVIQFIAEF